MRLHSTLVVLASLMACGGSQPPPASPAAPAGSSASASDTTATAAPSSSASPAPGGSDDKASGAPSMESQREPFLQGCMKKVQAPDYCQCGYEQFAQVFKDADLSKPAADGDPRFAKLQQMTMANCASKLPEDTVKAGFMSGCLGDDKKKAAYCQCAWPALRKTLALADFLGDFEGPRFDAAKKAMVATCKGKFPTELAKSEFLGACTKGDKSNTKACECVWGKLHAKYSTEEIESGLADIQSTPGVDKCGK